MDHRTARWMSLKRLSSQQLARFHALEKKAGNENGVMADAAGNWAAYATSYLARANERLGPFWARAKTEEEREKEVQAFERHIYPLWSPLLEPGNSSYSSDLAALHAADFAIYRDDYVVNREAGAPQASSAAAQVYA